MKHSSSLSEMLGGLAIILVIVVAGGYMYYSAVHQTVTPVVAANAYPTGVLDTEFNAGGVFAKTAQLGAAGVSPITVPEVPSTTEVGKTDLGSYEQ